ncbi:MAG: winged helix-turn-helix transcriptional regulator [Oscillospiraceae bacterium]|nr:winged helix-turn-helix transcriptional regulator [Oscillospiraceae bacterium]
MRENPKISAADLAKMLGIAERNVKNHIKTLKLAGLLERVGLPKGGYWDVSDKLKASDKQAINKR